MNFANLSATVKSLSIPLIAFTIIACQSETNAQTVDPSKYQNVPQQITPSTGDKVEVMELFWFGCGHCFALEPGIKNWKSSKPANAEFVKVPAIFTSNLWEFHGKAFYTMKALGLPDEAYDNFFNHLHIKRRGISDLDQLAEFISQYGKSADEVSSAFNSFDVDNKVRMAKKITRQSGTRGVPAIVVDGKYLTNQRLAGSTDQMFQVVNQLVNKSAAER